MGDLLRAHKDDSVLYFSVEDTTAYEAKTKILYFRLVKNTYEFEKVAFTPLTVKNVCELTNADPLWVELYMRDKVAPASSDQDTVII
jgi:hypothetical protein